MRSCLITHRAICSNPTKMMKNATIRDRTITLDLFARLRLIFPETAFKPKLNIDVVRIYRWFDKSRHFQLIIRYQYKPNYGQ